MNIFVLLFLFTLDLVCTRRVHEVLNVYGGIGINSSSDSSTTPTCDEYCQTVGFSHGTVFGSSPWCQGSCSTCRGQCIADSPKWNSGDACRSGEKKCCCEELKTSCPDFCLSHGYGWGVLEGTAPNCGADCETNCNAESGYCKEASPRLFTDYGSSCASGSKICCCKPVPLLDGKLPDGTQVMPLTPNKEFAIHVDALGITGMDIDSAGFGWTMHTAEGERTILVAKENPHIDNFKRRSVYMVDKNGRELFKIRRSKNKLNPFQWRWSFRILPPGSKSNSDALYTINGGVEKGVLAFQNENGTKSSVTNYAAWRIYRGRERDGAMIYYCVGSLVGWSFQCYPNQKSHKKSSVISSRNAVAHVMEHASGGSSFRLSVREGEDPLLLLSWLAIVTLW